MRGILPEWQELWNRLPHTTVFQSPHWLLPWIEVFQPIAPHLLEIREGDLLVGVIPLLIYARDSQRVLAFMGGGVSDYLDALVDPQYEREVLATFHDYLARECYAWDILEFTDLPAHSVLLRLAQVTPEFEVRPHVVCPVLSLPSRGQELSKVIPFRKRASLRNARNRLARAGGGRVEVASRESVLTALDSMFKLHSDRWATVGESGVLSETSIQDFHLRLAIRLVDLELLRLYQLFLKDHLVAALYTFFEKDVVRLYVHAFDPDCAHLSPGTQIFGAVIEDAVKQGMHSVDFLRGSEPYKYLWGACDSVTYSIQALSSHPANPAI